MLQRLCLLIALSLTVSTSADTQDATEITWDDLLPPDFTMKSIEEQINYSEYDTDSLSDGDADAQALYDAMREALGTAPVIDQYEGRAIKIPGFVVPLEQHGFKVASFLLVPYFGACIHTPPPPANQIIHVEVEEPFELASMMDPYYISGELIIERHESVRGTAGYAINDAEVAPYQ